MAYKKILKKPLPFQKRSLLWHNPHLKLPPPITIPTPPTKKMMATTTMLVIVQTLLHFNSQSKGQALLTLKTARTLQNLLYHSKFKAPRPLATTTMVVTVEIWAYVLGFGLPKPNPATHSHTGNHNHTGNQIHASTTLTEPKPTATTHPHGTQTYGNNPPSPHDICAGILRASKMIFFSF